MDAKLNVLLLILFFILCLLLSSCVMGVQKDYDETGKLVSSKPYLSLFQMQTREGSNTIYSEKGAGFDVKIPIPFTGGGGFNFLQCTLGYIGSTRLVLEKDAIVIVDTNIDPFNKGKALTDTVLHGGKATEDFYRETIKELIRAKNVGGGIGEDNDETPRDQGLND